MEYIVVVCHIRDLLLVPEAIESQMLEPETILGCCIMPGLIQPNLSHKASKVSLLKKIFRNLSNFN